jgi:hypothetical protein
MSQLLDYLQKHADSAETVNALETNRDEPTARGSATVYPNAPDAAPNDPANVAFSDAAQEVSKDVREGVVSRVLSSPATSNAAERELIKNVLKTRDFETSNIQIKPVEKVSYPRSQTLLEQVQSVMGRT